MSAEDNDLLIEHIEHRMTALNELPDLHAVAEFLERAQVTGFPECQDMCPVAMWFRMDAPVLLKRGDVEVNKDYVLVTRYSESCGCGCGIGDGFEPLLHEVHPSREVAEFIERFDDDEAFAPGLRRTVYEDAFTFYAAFADDWKAKHA